MKKLRISNPRSVAYLSAMTYEPCELRTLPCEARYRLTPAGEVLLAEGRNIQGVRIG
jgi:hypothetical protein